MMKSINQNSGDSVKSENNNTKLAANVSQRAIAAKDDDAAPRAFGGSSNSCSSDSNIGWDWAKHLPTRDECKKEIWPKMKRAEERLAIRLSKKAIEEDRMLPREEEPVVEQAVEPATVATEATPAQRSHPNRMTLFCLSF